jgi:hypothetical protein
MECSTCRFLLELAKLVRPVARSSCQWPAASRPLPAARRPPHAARCPPPAARRSPSAARRPLPAAQGPPTVARLPPPAARRPSQLLAARKQPWKRVHTVNLATNLTSVFFRALSPPLPRNTMLGDDIGDRVAVLQKKRCAPPDHNHCTLGERGVGIRAKKM